MQRLIDHEKLPPEMAEQWEILNGYAVQRRKCGEESLYELLKVYCPRLQAIVTGIQPGGELEVQFVNEGLRSRKAVVPADVRCVTRVAQSEPAELDTSVLSQPSATASWAQVNDGSNLQ